MVPIEVDQYGVGLTFGPQAHVDAKNRQNRRQAYLDSDPTVDFSQYSPEEMAQIKADAGMDMKSFGHSVLDQMEKRTGIDMSSDREHVEKTGGVGWTNPRIGHDKQLGAAEAQKREERYRNADPKTRARMDRFKDAPRRPSDRFK